MFKFLNNIFDYNARKIKSYQNLVKQINSLETKISKLTDDGLKKLSLSLKKRANQGVSLDELLPESFALVREAVKRTIGERAYDVQLMSAICLHQGSIAEQRTGEGKTHSVIFPAYLNSLTGQGVHIVTPNDYLTKIGTGWYTPALHLLGVNVAGIIHDQSFIYDPSYTNSSEKFDSRLSHLKDISRQQAYQADITYGTSNEFGFDYLRDHMAQDISQIVQTKHNFAIVDEVDFVLIDEARTPLIISSPGNQQAGQYSQYSQIAQNLQSTDYIIDEKARSATLTEYGIRKVERMLNITNLYEQSFQTIHKIENAIKAQALFHKDKDYVISDGQIIIVDEFTGRLMHGRRWSDGLHQAIEAKENVPIQSESQTWATITFQNYFRLYQKLAGMTGTAATEAEEFKQIYNLDVVVIPTHKTIKRIDKNDLIYKTKTAKYTAVAAKIEELHQLGQPVLVGTTSIENNQIVSSLLTKKKIPHHVLNAKNHQSEAQIISNAGKYGAVTVATNMAGRGVDIILGGSKENTPKTEWKKLHKKVVELGGLYVIGTERHESRRVDNQLRGRSGRQGDPGSSQFYVSLEDDLMRIFGGEKIGELMTRFNMPENAPMTHPLVSKALEQIQVKVEGHNFDQRKGLVEYDDVINKQRGIIYNLRDSVIKQAATSPLKNKKLLFSYLKKQINSIILLAQDDTGIDFKKVSLEFSEILPLNSSGRQALVKKLQDSKNPQKELLKILKSAWLERQKLFGKALMYDVLKYLFLTTLDPLWVEHLTILDDLKDGVRLRAYAQKDPLIEFRKDGFAMFQNLISSFEYNLARRVFRVAPNTETPVTSTPQVEEGRGDKIDFSVPPDSQSLPQTSAPTKSKTITNSTPKPGRNDPCPCGSGKKYKKCCYPKYD